MRLYTSIAVVLFLSSSASLAADATCDARAKEKKLGGAALKSFVTKCEKDSTEHSAADAKAKKLHGAADTSFTKKCAKDAVGSG